MERLIKLVRDFCRSFDEKDWELMQNCLSKDLEVDYQSFRGTPKQIISSKEYIAKRKIGLLELHTDHLSKNHKFTQTGEEIICTCDFEIKRFKKDSEDFFHSTGSYEFYIIENGEYPKICKIKQEVTKSIGNKNIHGAFKKS